MKFVKVLTAKQMKLRGRLKIVLNTTSTETSANLHTFADEIACEEAERSFRQVMTLLDAAATIKSAKANHIGQQLF